MGRRRATPNTPLGQQARESSLIGEAVNIHTVSDVSQPNAHRFPIVPVVEASEGVQLSPTQPAGAMS